MDDDEGAFSPEEVKAVVTKVPADHPSCEGLEQRARGSFLLLRSVQRSSFQVLSLQGCSQQRLRAPDRYATTAF